jgi:hypothetical protein
MFRRNHDQGLTLSVGEQKLAFTSTAEFEFALAGRACLPPAKVASLMAQNDDNLMREAEALEPWSSVFPMRCQACCRM